MNATLLIPDATERQANLFSGIMDVLVEQEMP